MTELTQEQRIDVAKIVKENEKLKLLIERIYKEGINNHNTRCKYWWNDVVNEVKG